MPGQDPKDKTPSSTEATGSTKDKETKLTNKPDGSGAYTEGTDIHIAPGDNTEIPNESWHKAQ